jgi:HD-like signal output (HDOD) protein
VNRILFVDDEAKVLEGLRRMLRPLRHGCHMQFALSGAEALELLAAQPCDVVISDMRMPGMDGCQLLETVMQRHPATARIVLSGHCDRQAVLKSVGVAHQFLSKPCDSEALKAVVVETCRLWNRMADPSHKRLVAQVRWVASPPSSCARLARAVQAAEPSLEALGGIMAGDVGMTARLLQLVCSGFFGPPQRGADACQGAVLLGAETLRLLCGSADVFRPLPGDHPALACIESLAGHSRQVAEMARAIAAEEMVEKATVAAAYVAGLLHDVGLFVLAEHFPDSAAQRQMSAQRERLPSWAVESRHFGPWHAELGGSLLALWGLPDPIVAAAIFHQRPSLDASGVFAPLCAVHVASAEADARALAIPAARSLIDMQYLARIGCAGRLDRWRQICQAVLEKPLPAENPRRSPA